MTYISICNMTSTLTKMNLEYHCRRYSFSSTSFIDRVIDIDGIFILYLT